MASNPTSDTRGFWLEFPQTPFGQPLSSAWPGASSGPVLHFAPSKVHLAANPWTSVYPIRRTMIGSYPNLTELELADRPQLEPLFRALRDGRSEMSFGGIYCFRASHAYRIGRLDDGTYLLAGSDKGSPFFICPFGLPRADLLDELFLRYSSMKLVTEAQAVELRQAGYEVSEDRDNFDYVYGRDDLAALHGRALQRKRNLVHAFEKRHTYEAYPFSNDRLADALAVLEVWRESAKDQADYAPSREALERAGEFGLHGRLYYVEGKPAGYTLGEEARAGTMFVVHYEKAVPDMKGLYQLINMDFARSLPPAVTLINREQDLGDPGLRQAKMTYRPCEFVKKYRARKAA